MTPTPIVVEDSHAIRACLPTGETATLALEDEAAGWRLSADVGRKPFPYTTVGWTWDVQSAMLRLLRRVVGCPWG